MLLFQFTNLFRAEFNKLYEKRLIWNKLVTFLTLWPFGDGLRAAKKKPHFLPVLLILTGLWFISIKMAELQNCNRKRAYLYNDFLATSSSFFYMELWLLSFEERDKFTLQRVEGKQQNWWWIPPPPKKKKMLRFWWVELC